jgi:uroporphyrinogen-III decarboxylase
MTRRENLLAALSHRQAERLPAFFVADNFNQPQPLPKGLGEDPFDSGIMRFLGGDVVDRIGISALVVRETPSIQYVEETRPDGSIHDQWRSSWGNLSRVLVPSKEGQTTFAQELPIKRVEDYVILKRILEDMRLSLDENALAAAHARLESVGDEGIVYTVGPSTPIMDLTRSWTGLERFVYDLCDHRRVVEEALALMHQVNLQQYELTARHTPGQVLVCWDDVNSLYLSRGLLEKYWVPTMRDYARIAHEQGKLLVMHTCGKLQGLLDLFPETHIDAVDWLTPPPTGDVTFAQAQSTFRGQPPIPPIQSGAIGGQITVMGAAEPEAMRFGTPDEVEVNLHRWLAGVELRRGFVFMVPCPLGTPLANAARVAKVLARDYGFALNTHPAYWPIWEDPAAHW